MIRFVLFALLSVIIFEARGSGLIVALLAAVIATFAAARLPPRQPASLRLAGVIAFIPFFFRESVRGGIDVALRAFRGSALDPGFVDYPLRLRHAGARVLFVNAVSLMPGTFTALIAHDNLRVHTLDRRDAIVPRLEQVEDRIIAIFDNAAE